MSQITEERIHVILLVGTSSCREVAKELNRLHPNCAPVTHRCVDKLVAKFKETESIRDKCHKRSSRLVMDAETIANVMAHFDTCPVKLGSLLNIAS